MIKIIIAGDYCPQKSVMKSIDKLQFENVFAQVRKVNANVDWSIVNLEAPIVEHQAPPIAKVGPNLRCSKKAIEALVYAGFDMVTLANNHLYDYGEKGVIETLKYCKQQNIKTVGAGINIKNASQIEYIHVKNKKIAIINVCENEFSIATQTTGGSNPLNPIANYYHIVEAKCNADYVIVITHGGHEHYNLPSPRMQKTYRFFIDIGASVVINHHQHCYSGYEIYHGKLIFYGLGNFCFDWNGIKDSDWNEGYLTEIIFDEERLDFKLHPYLQCDRYPSVQFIDKKQQKHFKENIDLLNKIILSETELSLRFIDFIKKNKSFLYAFEPYSGKYLSALFRRKCLPSFLTKQRKLLISNLVRCESHRDVILGLFVNIKK